MRDYFFFCPPKTAGKAICGHFKISNIHTLVKDIYHPNFKNFIKLQAIDITKYYYRLILKKKQSYVFQQIQIRIFMLDLLEIPIQEVFLGILMLKEVNFIKVIIILIKI